MFGKLLAIILTLALTAAALLTIRQQRLCIAHRRAVLHRRLLEHEQTLWRLQSEISDRCRPNELRAALEQTDRQWVPIPARPAVTPAVRLRLADADQPDDTGG
jgi:hypothetical protein